MDNPRIARILGSLADLCEIRGDNAFKVRALRSGAETIAALPHDVGALCETPDELRTIKGIGEGIAKKIVEIHETGTCGEYRELVVDYPESLLEILRIEGVGPKKVKLFYDELGVKSVGDLEAAARQGKVRDLPRMSEATEAKLLKAIEEHKARSGRFLISWAEYAVSRVVDFLREVPGLREIRPAGSLRRRRDTVGDLDLLAIADDPAAVIKRFAEAGDIIARGETKCSVRLSNGMQADLRVVPAESFGAALQYFTGSKAHNVAVRSLAQRKQLTVNEYGVFTLEADGTAGARVAGETEEDVYAALGLPWIPPELREDRGEIEAARAGSLPRLVELDDIQGDLHMHTTATDGIATVEGMALAAIERGRAYIAITDHSKALTMVRGLDETRLRDQARAIEKANEKLGDRIRVLRGIEVDILKDGTLDLDSDVLGELDVVVASVHSAFSLPLQQMTDRVTRAIRSGLIDVIAHPTGRLLLRRDAFEIDMEAVLEAAKEHGVAMEINAFPDRLDLSDTHCRLAKEIGVQIVISTDSHTPEQLDLLRYGVGNARRGWLEPEDVLNTLPVERLLKRLHEGHR